MATKIERVPAQGFETDYYNYVARREIIEEEVKAEYAKILAERTKKLDMLIDLTSEQIEVEVADEVENEEETSEVVTEEAVVEPKPIIGAPIN